MIFVIFLRTVASNVWLRDENLNQSKEDIMKKSDRLLVLSGIAIGLYIWIAMGCNIAGIFYPEMAKTWMGSLWSVPVGFVAMSGWTIFAITRMVFCGREIYDSLRPGEKKICHKYLKNAACELWGRMLQRKDKVGEVTRFVTSVVNRA